MSSHSSLLFFPSSLLSSSLITISSPSYFSSTTGVQSRDLFRFGLGPRPRFPASGDLLFLGLRSEFLLGERSEFLLGERSKFLRGERSEFRLGERSEFLLGERELILGGEGACRITGGGGGVFLLSRSNLDPSRSQSPSVLPDQTGISLGRSLDTARLLGVLPLLPRPPRKFSTDRFQSRSLLGLLLSRGSSLSLSMLLRRSGREFVSILCLRGGVNRRSAPPSRSSRPQLSTPRTGERSLLRALPSLLLSILRSFCGPTLLR
ncbi:unnamed protein product, partial [Nesidiocoris tenuis]